MDPFLILKFARGLRGGPALLESSSGYCPYYISSLLLLFG
jgi:hypothetical protein